MDSRDPAAPEPAPASPGSEPASPAAGPALSRRFFPPQGWGPILTELVIVVLGVMIALAAGQAAESWSWRKKAVDGEAAVQRDLETLVPVLFEQVANQPCVDAQLERLSKSVLDSGSTLAPAAYLADLDGVDGTLSRVVAHPSRPILFGAWETLVVDGTATHFAADRRKFYSDMASELDLLRSLNDQSDRVYARLYVLSYPLELDPGVRKDLLVEIADQRGRAGLAALVAFQAIAGIRQEGLMSDDKVVDGWMEDIRKEWSAVCQRLGKPPSDPRSLLKSR